MRRFLHWLTTKTTQETSEIDDNMDKQVDTTTTNRRLIVGLGNPGKKYRDTRHNIGFMLIDDLAMEHGIKIGKVKNKALVGTGTIAGISVVLAKPQTGMNISGNAVGPLAKFYKIPPEYVIVVYDELDLPFGTVRLRGKGGSGGHNGMKSLINHLGQEFPRIRLGIGRPPGRMPAAAYVLQSFGKDEEIVRDEMIDAGIAAIETWLTDGIELAMSRYNSKPK